MFPELKPGPFTQFQEQSKRLKVLRRDRFRCTNTNCPVPGRYFNSEGIGLEIDHIVPRASGGSNERSNLRTLCAICHKVLQAGTPVAGVKNNLYRKL